MTNDPFNGQRTARLIQAKGSLVVVERADGSSTSFCLAKFTKTYRKHFLAFEKDYFSRRGNRNMAKVRAWDSWRVEVAQEVAQVIDEGAERRRCAQTIIVEGDEDIQVLPWEAFRRVGGHFGDAVFIRRPSSCSSSTDPSDIKVKQINVLLVIARPFGTRDIAPSNIFETLKDIQTKSEGVLNVDVLRGGATLDLLRKRLSSRNETNRYNIVHFDAHGQVSTRAELARTLELVAPVAAAGWAGFAEGAPELDGSDEKEPFVFLEREPTGDLTIPTAAPVSVKDLVSALGEPLDGGTNAPPELVMMNACQSASPDMSMALSLVEHGVRAALGLRQAIDFEEASAFTHGFYTNLVLKVTNSVLESFRQAYKPGIGAIDRPESTLASLVIDGGRDFRYRLTAKPPRPSQWVELDPSARDFDELHISRLLFGITGNDLVVLGPRGTGKSALLARIEKFWLLNGFADRTCLIRVGYFLQAYSSDEERIRALFEQVATDFGDITDTAGGSGPGEPAAAIDLVLLIDGFEELDPATAFCVELKRLMVDLRSKGHWVIVGTRAGVPEGVLSPDHVVYPMIWDERRFLRDLEKATPTERVAAAYADGIPSLATLFQAAAGRVDSGVDNGPPETWLLTSDEVQDTLGTVDEKNLDALLIFGLLNGPPFPLVSSMAMTALLGGALGADDRDAKIAESDRILSNLEQAGFVLRAGAELSGARKNLFFVHPQLIISARQRLERDPGRVPSLSKVYAKAKLISRLGTTAMGDRPVVEVADAGQVRV